MTNGFEEAARFRSRCWHCQWQPLHALDAANSNGGPKVLRYAFRVAETGFDPAQVNDFYSSSINGNIFDAPLAYDFRAPTKIVLNTAGDAGDFSRLHDDHGSHPPRHLLSGSPGVQGPKRELTAQDYVY